MAKTEKRSVVEKRNKGHQNGYENPEGAARPTERRVPRGTHCLEAAKLLSIPVFHCPRRPTIRVPFCLLEGGEEVWLVHSSTALDGDSKHYQSQHDLLAEIMERTLRNKKRAALLYGANEPNPLDSGFTAYQLYHELYIEAGSMARSARYHVFWNDRGHTYREFRVPGPAALPDSELEPIVAANRCFLLPPTLPYNVEDKKSIHWKGYHEPGRDPMKPWQKREEKAAEDPEKAARREAREQAKLAREQEALRKEQDRLLKEQQKEQARIQKVVERQRQKQATAAERRTARQAKQQPPAADVPAFDAAAFIRQFGEKK